MLYLHPFSISTHPVQGHRGREPIPACIVLKAENTQTGGTHLEKDIFFPETLGELETLEKMWLDENILWEETNIATLH